MNFVVQSLSSVQFSSVLSLSRVWLFVTPWIAARQASLSITNSWSLLKLMPIELVMSSSHLILCCPLLLLPQSLPASESFPLSQFFARGGQSTGVSASASVLPMNTQSCPILCDPTYCSMQAFPVLHYLPGFVQTHVFWVNDAIQLSHSLSPPSLPTLNLSQVLELQLQHECLVAGYSYQWMCWNGVVTIHIKYFCIH